MPERKALAKMNGLRCYSRLRKAELIELIRTSLREESQPEIDEPIIEQPKRNDNKLTERQHKRDAQRTSKLKKKSKSLRDETDELKSQQEGIEDKIKKATKSTSSRFKGKKIRSMKREAGKLNEQIQEKTKELKSIEENLIVRTSQQSKENRRIKRKIEGITRKIRRAKGKTKRNLMIK